MKLVGLDSTPLMLDIAKKRHQKRQLTNQVSFHHVGRDVTMETLKMTVGPDAPFDWVVSTFVIHYVDFDRRVELTSFFLDMAPKVLYVTWGDQSKVGFLRAIKTFATWKGSQGAKDILDT